MGYGAGVGCDGIDSGGCSWSGPAAKRMPHFGQNSAVRSADFPHLLHSLVPFIWLICSFSSVILASQASNSRYFSSKNFPREPPY